ncbi:MAG: valine--tRNA ligase, partial [Microbacteriaceae bacterium]
LFDVEVPIVAHHLAQQDKGTGIAMVCTFGDVTDVVWWRELHLPNRAILGFDGRVLSEAPEAITSEAGREHYESIAGKTVFSAKKIIVEALQASGELIGEIRNITHPVKFFEKGDKPLEIVSTRQWYIKNGAHDEALRERLLAHGKALSWHPDFMRVRYENWVEGLSGDWLISRQRFFGVPIPVWYPLNDAGEPNFDAPILPTEAQLPVDPSSDVPSGYTEQQRGEAGGFIGEVDVMDTWATSSITPQLAGGWERDAELFDLVYPYDLRPQGQDIIRTWLFSTLLRSELEASTLPWKNAGISGWILDPDRKKMSKSKGNVVTPASMLDQHGSDAVRYWAASAKLGTDASFDPQNPTQIKIGRRLAIKVLNASKFTLGFEATPGATVTELLDQSMLKTLAGVVRDATAAFESYDHARALEITESSFWTFCDDYLELVKDRAHGEVGQAQASAVAALRVALSVYARLFAPFIPFATEEVWSWFNEGSVHQAAWPVAEELTEHSGEATSATLDAVSQALIGIRGAKSTAKVSQKTVATRVEVGGPQPLLEQLRAAEGDLTSVGHIEELVYTATEAAHIEILAVDLQLEDR